MELTTKFGLGQLNNPTPQTAKVIFRIILYVSAMWAVAAPVITELSPATLAIINKYLILSNALVNVTIKFFGLDYK
jgi:hypothetical protein